MVFTNSHKAYLQKIIKDQNCPHIHITNFVSAFTVEKECKICCSLCMAFENIYSDMHAPDEYLDLLESHTLKFIESHRHGKVKGNIYIPATISWGCSLLTAYLQDMGFYNLETNESYSFSVGSPEGNPIYIVKCKTCNLYQQLQLSGNYLSLEVKDVINNFAAYHKHDLSTQEMKYKFYKIEKDYTKSDALVKLKNLASKVPLISAKPGQVIPINKIEDVKVLDIIQVTQGRPLNQTTVSQETLKEIYKLSDFNVELQAKVKGMTVIDYRAHCSKCEATLNIIYTDIISNNRDNSTWISLIEFCKVHKHIMDIIYGIKGGRKFKEVE